jgi:hypothetical protein
MGQEPDQVPGGQGLNRRSPVFPELFLHSLYAAVLVIRQAFSVDRQDVQSVLESFDAIRAVLT